MVTKKYLRNYAEWYYTQYFPSIQKLRQKLLEKTQDIDLVDEVIRDLSELFVEDKIIESQIHALLSRWKTAYEIRMQLVQKQFSPDIIDAKLVEATKIINDPDRYRHVIEKLINTLWAKGYAKRRIQQEIKTRYPDAQELITELLWWYDDEEAREIFLKKNDTRYTGQKLRQKLYEAGF